MKKLSYVFVGGVIGAGLVYGAMQNMPKAVVPQPEKKPITYKDIINPPAGEYGKGIVEKTVADHTNIFHQLEGRAANLQAGQTFIELNPYSTAPLSAVAGLKTAEPTLVEVRVYGQEGQPAVTFSTQKLETVHLLPVLGLLPNTLNKVELVTFNPEGNPQKVYQLEVQTQPLPKDTPLPKIVKGKTEAFHNQLYFVTPSEGKGMGPQTPYSIGFDEMGRIRWAFTADKGATVLMKPWKDGKWLSFMPNKLANARGGSTKYLMAFDLTGRIHNVWYAPNRLHHDFALLNDGTINIATDTDVRIEDVAIRAELTDAPHLKILEQIPMENAMHPRPVILDVQAGYLPSYDWFHMNGIAENPTKGYTVYSGRNQSAVVALNNKDHSLRWIMADPNGWLPTMQPYLLKPKGEGFEWSWGQHSPVWRDSEHLFLFDNGNFRSVTFDGALKAHENYSRIVEYKINDATQTIEQVWSYGKERGHELYAPYVGGVNYIAKTNTVVGVFGGILQNRLGNPSDIVAGTFKNKAHIVEVTHTTPPQLLADFVFEKTDHTTDTGYMIYRGYVCDVYCAYNN